MRGPGERRTSGEQGRRRRRGERHLRVRSRQLRPQRLPGAQHMLIALPTHPLDALQQEGLQGRLLAVAGPGHERLQALLRRVVSGRHGSLPEGTVVRLGSLQRRPCLSLTILAGPACRAMAQQDLQAPTNPALNALLNGGGGALQLGPSTLSAVLNADLPPARFLACSQKRHNEHRRPMQQQRRRGCGHASCRRRAAATAATPRRQGGRRCAAADPRPAVRLYGHRQRVAGVGCCGSGALTQQPSR